VSVKIGAFTFVPIDSVGCVELELPRNRMHCGLPKKE
jgi:hypothetical protein